ncbi:MAG: right-handed parallel beta-helix repeat-containing protein [Chitinophagaceae bacterium]|nr:right-handed parallel beta-helix repeat-containing protein [Chitinophagaceae bacterium]
MHITSSVRIVKDNYLINGSDSLKDAVIVIEGDDIVVDFNGAELKGSNDKLYPNEFYGCAILIKKGKNISIKNANIHGFKVGLMATNVEELLIKKCDFSYNYRQKLHSNRLREDVSDWMSYHHNENDEWLRYGAGIYLRDCNKINVHDNIITGGQCGLMMTRCNDGLVSVNNFSFNSGLGIGMYRSSRNKIFNNTLDFNVRGYSHGIYNRGQDSADILVFEQCNGNEFSFNSATHGGDGFFLWAGQHTMDTGEGGCNGNIIYKNNFSYAPTNGVEVTFSKNDIVGNTIAECDNGIWGGYSFNSTIYQNTFSKNNVAIAIEQGQNNDILQNIFDQDKTAIKLWARKEQPKDWGYAQHRDVRSRDYRIEHNSFFKNNIAIQATLSDSITLFKNNFDAVKNNFKTDSTAKFIIEQEEKDVIVMPDNWHKLRGISGDYNSEIFAIATAHPGKKEIRITQWGPYDYRYPTIWLTNIDSTGKMFFDVLGPGGKWNIKNSKGVKNISAIAGSFPASFTAEKTGDDISIGAEYSGEKFTTQFGEKIPANKPYAISYKEFSPQITWDVKWYKWDLAHDPNKDYHTFKTIFSNTPIKTETNNKLDYTWWGEIGKGLAADSFATVATGILQVPKGKYDLGVTADDLLKVFIDGKPVINFWDATKYVNDEDAHHSAIVELDGYKHNIRIEHVENAGYATLIFSLTPL